MSARLIHCTLLKLSLSCMDFQLQSLCISIHGHIRCVGHLLFFPESKSSVIGKRRGPSKPGLGGKKGLGGQKVTSKNFEEAEKEAAREDEERVRRGAEDAAGHEE